MAVCRSLSRTLLIKPWLDVIDTPLPVKQKPRPTTPTKVEELDDERCPEMMSPGSLPRISP